MIYEYSFDEWCNAFKPIGNHLGDNASFGGWLEGEEQGIMFETYGDELVHVLKTAQDAPKTVWTYVDSESGTSIIEGLHYVNRIGYFITQIPAELNRQYCVEVSR